MSKVFESHKKVTVIVMDRLAYNIYRGWELPVDENGSDEGYLVEYLDGGKPNHPDHKGYISWSPKEQFDNGYTEVVEKLNANLTFGEAIQFAKSGNKVSRSGWNGKGMFLFAITSWDFDTDVSGVDNIDTDAFICMKTAGNSLIPWLASQSDILAEDWMVID